MRVAVVGSGGIARRHLEALHTVPGMEIVGHVTRTPEHAAEAAREWGGRAYADHRQLLMEEDPDAVWVCVPPGEHGAIEHDLLERRIPFFVEKPLDADCSTAEGIAAEIAQSGVVVGVGYHWRALDTVPEVRRMIRGNRVRMAVAAWHAATPPPGWWGSRATGGGQIVEQATHLFDLARFLLGDATVVAALATHLDRAAHPGADVAEVSAALLQFDMGAPGSFTATCLLGGTADVSLRLICEGLLITITQQRVIYDDGATQREVLVTEDPFKVEDRAFRTAVETNDAGPIFCTYHDALRTHRLCCAVRAMAEGA